MTPAGAAAAPAPAPAGAPPEGEAPPSASALAETAAASAEMAARREAEAAAEAAKAAARAARAASYAALLSACKSTARAGAGDRVAAALAGLERREVRRLLRADSHYALRSCVTLGAATALGAAYRGAFARKGEGHLREELREALEDALHFRLAYFDGDVRLPLALLAAPAPLGPTSLDLLARSEFWPLRTAGGARLVAALAAACGGAGSEGALRLMASCGNGLIDCAVFDLEGRNGGRCADLLAAVIAAHGAPGGPQLLHALGVGLPPEGLDGVLGDGRYAGEALHKAAGAMSVVAVEAVLGAYGAYRAAAGGVGAPQRGVRAAVAAAARAAGGAGAASAAPPAGLLAAGGLPARAALAAVQRPAAGAVVVTAGRVRLCGRGVAPSVNSAVLHIVIDRNG